MTDIKEIKSLGKIKYFNKIVEKLTLNNGLDDKELNFILSISIVLLEEYNLDKRKKGFLNFAYFILLKVGLINNYYQPLYDLSVNLGLYPVSRFIFNKELLQAPSIECLIKDVEIDKYESGNIVEMHQQRDSRIDLLNSSSLDNSYIAPTSYGKSSLVKDIIRENIDKNVALIVPSKSLVSQNVNDLRKLFGEKKIIFHDDMFDGGTSNIFVLTQERALRILSKDIFFYFDFLIVDEAHNIFESDNRAILLTRLIRRNRKRFESSKHYYLSPLISDSSNLKYEEKQKIFERKIRFNIKEPELYEYLDNGDSYKYNRYFDELYKVSVGDSIQDYILKNSGHKNFIYLRTPRKVEEFSKFLINSLKENQDLNELATIIAENVHEEFYCVEYIKKGLIYLHGRLPDFIKEFLEYKFKNDANIIYLVANSVVLEGVNFPIDTLFIANTYKMNLKDLNNLIGRVNRLNDVFSERSENLNKLCPKIHFLNNPYFSGKKARMYNKMKLLRNYIFEDEIKNPTLLKGPSDESIINDSISNGSLLDNLDELGFIKVKDIEDFLVANEDKEDTYFLRVLLENNIHTCYSSFHEVFELLERKLDSDDWDSLDLVDKVYFFFIKDMDYHLQLRMSNFLRFNRLSVRNFYKKFIVDSHTLPLKAQINSMVDYFNYLKRSNSYSYYKFYIGDGFGEISGRNENGKKSYIDLSLKSYKELVNIAIIKLKNEGDFISFTFSNFVNVLYQIGVVSESEYNNFMYGTEVRENIDLVKIGLNIPLINLLKNRDQIKNISINNGRLLFNNDFLIFYKGLDALKKFEISRFFYKELSVDSD